MGRSDPAVSESPSCEKLRGAQSSIALGRGDLAIHAELCIVQKRIAELSPGQERSCHYRMLDPVQISKVWSRTAA